MEKRMTSKNKLLFQELNRKGLDLNNIIPESELENLIKHNKKNSSEEN